MRIKYIVTPTFTSELPKTFFRKSNPENKFRDVGLICLSEAGDSINLSKDVGDINSILRKYCNFVAGGDEVKYIELRRCFVCTRRDDANAFRYRGCSVFLVNDYPDWYKR